LTALADAWQVWIAGCLLRGRPADELVRALIEEGLSADDAAAVVREQVDSPAFRAMDAAIGHVRRAGLLRRAVLRTGTRELARIPPDPELYRRGFACLHSPVVLEGALTSWPALGWTWEGLRARCGDARVSVLVDRERVGAQDEGWDARNVECTFAAFLDGLHAGAPGCVTARNQATGPLAALLDDIPGVPGIAVRPRSGTAFWIGPAGTRTALHRDLSTTLLCQVLGRKRVWLVPPEEDVEVSDRPHWAAPTDLTRADLAVREVVLEPGEALSLPVGWWHEAVALDASFTVTLANLEIGANRFDPLIVGGGAR
jgi:hypothetical protein